MSVRLKTKQLETLAQIFTGPGSDPGVLLAKSLEHPGYIVATSDNLQIWISEDGLASDVPSTVDGEAKANPELQRLRDYFRCSECNGTGRAKDGAGWGGGDCSVCHGKGWHARNTAAEIPKPPTST